MKRIKFYHFHSLFNMLGTVKHTNTVLPESYSNAYWAQKIRDFALRDIMIQHITSPVNTISRLHPSYQITIPFFDI